MTTTPTPAPLAHGHASDADALLLIVALYTARAVEALGAYYRATAAAQDRTTLLGVGAAVLARELALDRSSFLDDAADELRTVWAQHYGRPTRHTVRSLLAELGVGGATREARRRAWLAAVVADVVARLDGDLERPLPQPPELELDRAPAAAPKACTATS